MKVSGGLESRNRSGINIFCLIIWKIWLGCESRDLDVYFMRSNSDMLQEWSGAKLTDTNNCISKYAVDWSNITDYYQN